MKSSSSCSISKTLLFSPYLYAFLAFLLFLSVFRMEDLNISSPQDLDRTITYHQLHRGISITTGKKMKKKLPFAIGEAGEGCDVFSGKWVRDYDHHPLYEEWECPYIIPQLTCLQHGRPETDYQYWKWQPHACSLPRFNARAMLEMLRGKRLMFVGDSLNRGQFMSMVCLLQRVIPENAKSMEDSFDSLSVFTAKDFNATIEFYWAPYLLESNSDNPISHNLIGSVVRNNSIDTHGKNWREADIIVFNTYLWWMADLKILKGNFNDEEKEIVEVPRDDAYRMAMKNLVQWINNNVDPQRTRIFFRTASPAHKSSRMWGDDQNGNCYNQTSMIEKLTFLGAERSIMQVIAEEFGKSRIPITLLNVTELSAYRKDAHTSIYKKQWRNLTAEQLANPTSYADCIHWCLPGVQDTWNELFYTKLFYP